MVNRPERIFNTSTHAVFLVIDLNYTREREKKWTVPFGIIYAHFICTFCLKKILKSECNLLKWMRILDHHQHNRTTQKQNIAEIFRRR